MAAYDSEEEVGNLRCQSGYRKAENERDPDFAGGHEDATSQREKRMKVAAANVPEEYLNGSRTDSKWSLLAEELKEKIAARLPLKCLMQSIIWSKKWHLLHNSKSFQAEVSSVSSRWESYYPLYVTDKDLMGFSRISSEWVKLFSLPEFPEDFCRGFSGPLAWTLSLCSITGSLIILSYFSNHILHIYVSNPINKLVNRLPPLDLTHDAPLDPRFEEWDDSVLVLPVTSHSYKVLVFTRNVAANVLQVRVYDSLRNVWSEPQRGPVLPGDFRGLDSNGYLGRTFYLAFLKSRDETPCTLKSCLEELMLFYAYDTESGVFKEIVLPSPQKVPDVPIRVCKLVVCGSELLLVVGQGSKDQDEEQRLESMRIRNANGSEIEEDQLDPSIFSQDYLYIPKESLFVFRLDPKTLQLSEISRGPSEKLSSRTFTGMVVCDKDCIYLQTESHGDNERGKENEFGVVMFDMRMQVWSPLPVDVGNRGYYYVNVHEWSFQPGLNPFVCP